MKTNGKHEVIAGIARQSLVLAAFLAMVVSVVGMSHAQSSGASAATPAANPAVAPAAASASPPAKHSAKGQHEGVTVHGHWIIEVKNPDGKVVTRREFENSLAVGNGPDLLTGALSGQYVPGGFYIFLSNGSGEMCSQGTLCLYDARYTCANGTASSSTICGAVTYSPNAATNGSTVGFTLNGTASNVANGVTISQVQSGVVVCIAAPPPATSDSLALYSVSPQQCGINAPSSSGFAGVLLALTNAFPTAVNVTTGQSVSVNVVITFS
jgi:hypothetical protein